MDTEFCIEALKEALARYGALEIFNKNQESRFTGPSYMEDRQIRISMDGRGR